MRRIFISLLLVVCCFLSNQVSFTLAFDQEPDTNIIDLVGGRVINKDEGVDKESKKQKKKKGKGKVIKPIDADDVILTLDRIQEEDNNVEDEEE